MREPFVGVYWDGKPPHPSIPSPFAASMRTQVLDERSGARRFALVFETGDEVMDALRAFAEEHDVAGARFTAIGAFERATLAYWDWERKAYEDHDVDEQVECVSLIGNVALAPDGRGRKVHAHVCIGMRDGSARAGHLRRARVRPTLELFLDEVPVALARAEDPATGLALLRPS